jgi:predicted transcriptional regulator
VHCGKLFFGMKETAVEAAHAGLKLILIFLRQKAKLVQM